jgi:hypothetical protein
MLKGVGKGQGKGKGKPEGKGKGKGKGKGARVGNTYVDPGRYLNGWQIGRVDWSMNQHAGVDGEGVGLHHETKFAVSSLPIGRDRAWVTTADVLLQKREQVCQFFLSVVLIGWLWSVYWGFLIFNKSKYHEAVLLGISIYSQQ